MKASIINIVAVRAAMLVVVVLLAEANVSDAAVTCNPTELSICSGAVSSNSPPPPACCAKIKEQQPCFCQYLKNPNVSKLINTPAAKKVASTCGVAIPKC